MVEKQGNLCLRAKSCISQYRDKVLYLNIDLYMIWPLVSKRRRINKNLPSLQFLFIRWHSETKRLSRIKTIIHIQYQCPLPNLTPSASSHKINFRILTRAFLQELEFCLMDDLSIWSTPKKNTIYVFLM